MAVNVTTPTRVITWNNQTLADLNPAAPIEDVLRMHAAQHPVLATAILEGPVLTHGLATYTVQTRVGTKG